jgi:predicted Zn finger-like uncharacterized protein
MIVNCPACSARYRIDPAKITGRGAKITCPRCSHKFVVYKDGDGAASSGPRSEPTARPRAQSDILDRDFRRVGITWRVRQGTGVTYSFHDLRSLRRYVDEGRIKPNDSLSYDSFTWVPLDSIDDLELYFRDMWRKGERGEIGVAPKPTSGRSEEDEEGPTTIMRHGNALMDDIRRAVAEATTPPPAPRRETDDAPTPRTSFPRESAFDDPTTFSRRTPNPRGDRTDTGSDGPTRVGPVSLGAVGRPAAPQPSPKPAPQPGPLAPQAPAADSDNTLVLVVSVVGLVLLLGMLGFAAWYSGIVQFGGPAARAPVEPAAPVQALPGAPARPAIEPAAPVPGDPPPEAPPAAPSDAKPTPPPPSSLIPADPPR